MGKQINIRQSHTKQIPNGKKDFRQKKKTYLLMKNSLLYHIKRNPI